MTEVANEELFGHLPFPFGCRLILSGLISSNPNSTGALDYCERPQQLLCLPQIGRRLHRQSRRRANAENLVDPDGEQPRDGRIAVAVLLEVVLQKSPLIGGVGYGVAAFLNAVAEQERRGNDG